MSQNQLSEYRRTQLFGMSHVELIVMLYSGAIRYLREAIGLIAAERYDQSWRKFDRARRIVVHLCGTLNRDAGDIADKLSALYAFLVEQITVANARRDVKVAEDCIEILTTLKEGWAGIVEHGTTPAPAETTPLPVSEPAPVPSGGVSVHA